MAWYGGCTESAWREIERDRESEAALSGNDQPRGRSSPVSACPLGSAAGSRATNIGALGAGAGESKKYAA